MCYYSHLIECLGVCMDYSLSFKKHIDYLHSKLNKIYYTRRYFCKSWNNKKDRFDNLIFNFMLINYLIFQILFCL